MSLKDSLKQCCNCKYVKVYADDERVYCMNINANNYPYAIKPTVNCKYKEQ